MILWDIIGSNRALFRRKQQKMLNNSGFLI